MLLAITLEWKWTLCHMHVLLPLLDAITLDEDTGFCGSPSLWVIMGRPHPYYLSPGQGGDKSGPYAPPVFTRKDGEGVLLRKCE
jgi:hypothetical protein